MINGIHIDLSRVSRLEFEDLARRPNSNILTDESTAWLVGQVVTSWPYEQAITDDSFLDLPLADSRVVENAITEALGNVAVPDGLAIDLNRITRREFNAMQGNITTLEEAAEMYAKLVTAWPFSDEITAGAFLELDLLQSKQVEAALLAEVQAVSSKNLGKRSTSQRSSQIR